MGDIAEASCIEIQEAAYAASMDSMMAPLPAPLTGTPDRDFALEMSQHHQVRTFKDTKIFRVVLWEAVEIIYTHSIAQTV